MSKYSALNPATGKHEEIVWREIPDLDNIYNVYLGEWRIGQLFRDDEEDSWVAVSVIKEPKGFRRVDGFATRWYGTIYLIRCIDGRDS